MIKPGFFARYTQSSGGNRELTHLDLAQEYILEYMRLQGLFNEDVVFKGGTALRKFIFGRDGRLSTDLDFGLLTEDASMADYVLDIVNNMDFCGVRVELSRRRGANAELIINTPFGNVGQPAAISVRRPRPWLPVVQIPPQPFDALDRGLVDCKDFNRTAIPIVDPREIAAEKIAAFWRRRMARDLYDLEHLGRALQATFEGPTICTLGMLKIYHDVADEQLGRPLPQPADIFNCSTADIQGRNDLGHLHVGSVDVEDLLRSCRQRYRALQDIDPHLASLVATCNQRERRTALAIREELVAKLSVAP